MKFFNISGDDIRPPPNRDVESAKRGLAKTILNPRSWFDSAARLIFAMRELEPSVSDFWRAIASVGTDQERAFPSSSEECVSVHLMLGGLAIENLCKGHIAGQLSEDEKAMLEVGKWPPRLDRQHNLLQLVRDTGLKISAFEEELLTRVQESVKWRGRYPAPISHTQMGHEIYSGCDDHQINLFIERLRTQVGATPQ